MISVTTPDPTVLPPSRIANLSPSSIAIGVIRLIVHHDVVARHAHFCAFRKLQISCYVCCSEIELRSVSIEERCMSAAFFLLQYVYLSFELVCADEWCPAGTVPVLFRFRFSVRLSSSAPMLSPVSALSRSFLNISTPVTTTFLFSSVRPTISTSFPYFEYASFYSACRYCTTSCDGEYVFNRHQERLVVVSFRFRNVAVYCFRTVQ